MTAVINKYIYIYIYIYTHTKLLSVNHDTFLYSVSSKYFVTL